MAPRIARPTRADPELNEFDQTVRRQLFERVQEVVAGLEQLGFSEGMQAREKAARLAAIDDLTRLAQHVDELTARLNQERYRRTFRGRVQRAIRYVFADESGTQTFTDRVYLIAIGLGIVAVAGVFAAFYGGLAVMFVTWLWKGIVLKVVGLM